MRGQGRIQAPPEASLRVAMNEACPDHLKCRAPCQGIIEEGDQGKGIGDMGEGRPAVVLTPSPVNATLDATSTSYCSGAFFRKDQVYWVRDPKSKTLEFYLIKSPVSP